ncbi:hypothetical protein PIB30_067808, partial [Stylosanthes scabra]|nr:hypothetical protein [Stylosanthes scabra]
LQINQDHVFFFCEHSPFCERKSLPFVTTAAKRHVFCCEFRVSYGNCTGVSLKK